MRQAYDYWQNQPGNYLESKPKRPPLTAPESLKSGAYRPDDPRRGRVVSEEGVPESTQPLGSWQQRVNAGRRALQAIQLPPLSSPKCGPPQSRGRQKPNARTVTCTPQEEDAVHPHVSTECRKRAWAYPQVSYENVSHRPTIHRLHPRPLEDQRGFRCGETVNARLPEQESMKVYRKRTGTKACTYSATRCRLQDLWRPGLRLRDDRLRRQAVEKRLAASVRGPAPPYGSEGRTLTSWLSPSGCCPSFSYTHRTPLRLAGSRKRSCAKVVFL